MQSTKKRGTKRNLRFKEELKKNKAVYIKNAYQKKRKTNMKMFRSFPVIDIEMQDLNRKRRPK